jgi:hypothetical protein
MEHRFQWPLLSLAPAAASELDGERKGGIKAPESYEQNMDV